MFEKEQPLERPLYSFPFPKLSENKPYYELQVELPMLDFFDGWRVSKRFISALSIDGLSINDWSTTSDYKAKIIALLDEALAKEASSLKSVWARENILTLATSVKKEPYFNPSLRLLSKAAAKSFQIRFKYLKPGSNLATLVIGIVYKLEENALLVKSYSGIKRYWYSRIYNVVKLDTGPFFTNKTYSHLTLIFKPETDEKNARVLGVYGERTDEGFQQRLKLARLQD